MRLGKVKKGRKGVVAGHSFVNRAVPSNGLIGNRPSLLLSPPSLLSSLEKKPSSLNSREQGILGEMKIESNNQASLARSDSSVDKSSIPIDLSKKIAVRGSTHYSLPRNLLRVAAIPTRQSKLSTSFLSPVCFPSHLGLAFRAEANREVA